MPSYSGYQGYGAGYGDPERAKVDRARQMAELLQQGATDTSPKSFWEGAAQLGKAFIARGAMDKADKAETSYAKNQARLLNHFLDPNTTADGFSMQPTINVGADPEPEAAAPAPAFPMPNRDKMRALASVLGGVYEGDGLTPDIGAKQVALPPMRPGVSQIAAVLGAPPQTQSGAPAVTPAATPAMATSTTPMAAQMASASSFLPPQPAAPDRRAALQSAMRLTGGNLEQAMSLVEAKYGAAPAGPEYQFLQGPDGSVLRADKTSGGFEVLQPGTPKPDASDIRQVGNQIVERQQDGSWKPVYTGSNAVETARAFQGFIDRATGRQMVVMSNGRAVDTGYEAYVPPQITSIGGVPSAVDKRTYETTELAPLEAAAGNKAAMASAEVQGKAQGQAAFDLPGIEFRSQTAINSITDLKSRNIGQRFGMQGKLYAIPGTEGADIQSLVSQVVSQAFLNAFDQLRGAGAITQTEGEAATAAITRLRDQNISVAEALNAMDELQGYYRKGIEVARQRATKAPVLPNRPAAAAGGTRTREGVPYLLAKPTPTGSTLTPEEQAELEALRAEFPQ